MSNKTIWKSNYSLLLFSQLFMRCQKIVSITTIVSYESVRHIEAFVSLWAMWAWLWLGWLHEVFATTWYLLPYRMPTLDRFKHMETLLTSQNLMGRQPSVQSPCKNKFLALVFKKWPKTNIKVFQFCLLYLVS